jgi:hypothetical protein
MTAHVARRDMAGIDRRPAGGKQRDEGGLRPFQMKSDLVVAVGGDIFKVSVPRLAGIEAQLVAGLAAEHFPGAFDILGGEGLAVVPLDAFPQRQGQLGPFLIPRPAGGQVRDDRCHTVLRHVLPKHDKIIEHPHHRPLSCGRRFLVHRHARRAVEVADFEDTTRFLS